MSIIEELADCLMFGALLEELQRHARTYDVVAHWAQGEFHHDIVLELPEGAPIDLPGRFLVVATNCNGGVKEVLCFERAPERYALWHHRCPEIADFSGEIPPILARAVTHHWFDPCELLRPDARSELRPEFRRRQRGGGWEQAESEPARAPGCGANRKGG